MRSSSAFSINGLVTSRRAVAAASWVASLATRVLRCTCNARYNTDKTTAIEPTNCEIALIASQFIAYLILHAYHFSTATKSGGARHYTPKRKALNLCVYGRPRLGVRQCLPL